jgi:hypothetical protein
MLIKVPPMTINSTYSQNEVIKEGLRYGVDMAISYLINAVTQTFQLLNSPSCLFVGIITCSNSTHTSRFVPSVTLCAVIKIRVGSSRAVSIKRL